MKLTVEDFPLPPTSEASADPRIAAGWARAYWPVAFLILLTAIALRVYPSAGFKGVGFDEVLYRDYLIKLDTVGLSHFPEICEVYLEDQRKPEQITKLPPTRFLYIYTSWLWKRLAFGDAPPASQKVARFAERDPALVSLHRVACLFSCLLVVIAGLCTWRIFGRGPVLAVLALMAAAPLQIHMAQHALIDGFFAFWATLCLWLLWENLRHPNHAPRLIAYGLALVAMVTTKENSFFVFVALCGLLAVNRWTRFGSVTPKLLLATFSGALLGVAFLVTLAGGADTFIEIYRLLVAKAETLRYAVMTGDGPWYRYLVDLMLVGPIVLCLALGGLFTQLKTHRGYLYLAAFVGFTYAIMCNVKFGMNLRYATIWDLPMRVLAVAQIGSLTARFGEWQTLASTLIIAGLCAYDLRQYTIFFTDFGLYELVSEGLLRAVKILK